MLVFFHKHNKRLKRGCQHVAFPVPMSRLLSLVLCVASPLGGRYVLSEKIMKKSLILALASLSFGALANEEVINCDTAFTTVEVNQCAAIELDAAKTELEKYLKASFDHNSFDPKLVEAMKLAQTDLPSHCDSVYTQWRDGTIRGVMGISCKTKLTKQRTHELWENFLTYMDSTPPVLPEPSL